MKVHYINILLFALPLNILEHNQRNHKSPTQHTPKIPNTRLLCECELYIANYDNDPQIKSVMDNFNKQTEQRFHEYDNRMQENRQKCKKKCDKVIQKIILKDKIEKELSEKLATLQTHIQSDSIPACVCEKSVADKIEKGCLKCGGVFGGIAPSVSLLGGIGQLGLNVWKTAAIKAATKEAIAEATDAATQAGVDAVVSKLKELLITWVGKDALDLSPIVSKSNFKYPTVLLERAKELFGEACSNGKGGTTSFCNSYIYYSGENTFHPIAQVGATTYDTTFASQKPLLEAAKVGAVESTYGSCQTAIIASIVTIVVIVLIMVIIYLILRYRRKKKMKKKLQYIKLLE
ncbi:surface antigen [Plasmodium falciparum UGT5.1]|uniref:Surface antigen n=1 Tax=Plasmodium falciparum UGT5.1 TaxID=1237627 RepID=W7K568_PLAFA|nr:surface antigen [Plasmodium falciparum UGT5.1]